MAEDKPESLLRLWSGFWGERGKRFLEDMHILAGLFDKGTKFVESIPKKAKDAIVMQAVVPAMQYFGKSKPVLESAMREGLLATGYTLADVDFILAHFAALPLEGITGAIAAFSASWSMPKRFIEIVEEIGMERLAHELHTRLPSKILGLGEIIQWGWWEGKTTEAYESARKLGFDAEQYTRGQVAMMPKPDLGMAASLAARTRDPEGYFAIVADRLGWPNMLDGTRPSRDAREYYEMVRRLPGQGELHELIRRGKIEPADVSKFFAGQGYTKDHADLLTGLYERLPDYGMITELWRRGLIDDASNKERLAKLGFDKALTAKLPDAQWRLPDPITLSILYHRNLIDKEQYIDALHKHGYSGNIAKVMEQASWLLPTPTDLVRFGLREVYTPEILEKFRQMEDFPEAIMEDARKIGLTRDSMQKYWAAHWDLPSPGDGFEMMHRGIIDYDELKMLLRARDVMPFWRDRLIQISYNLVPRRVIGRLVKQDLVEDEKIVDLFKKLGFSPTDALLMAESEKKRAAVAQELLSKGQIDKAFAVGWINEREMKEFFTLIGYKGDLLSYHMATAQQKRADEELKRRQEGLSPEADRLRQSTRDNILKGFRDGMIDKFSAVNSLIELQYESVVAVALVRREELRQSLDDMDHFADQIKRRFDRHLIEDSEAVAQLANSGFAVRQARRLLDLWTAERTTDEQLDAIRDRRPTKADLESWLTKGVIDPAMWADHMGKLGYDDTTVQKYLLEIVAGLPGV